MTRRSAASTPTTRLSGPPGRLSQRAPLPPPGAIPDNLPVPAPATKPPVPRRRVRRVPAGPVPLRRRVQVWRSPVGQPVWARPLLLLVAVLAAVSYTWHAGTTLNVYYGATVHSMAKSWHNFIYGAFDPAGSITVNRLPGPFWLQALSFRFFGDHEWALLLPQAVEGVLTVLVLYRCVRRLGGPVAGMVAAVILAAYPATTALNRGNMPDSLMVLLLVLAADSTVAAIVTGRWRSVLGAGVWVGLAFQAEMLEAWVVLPGLALAYLFAGRPDAVVERLGRVAAAAGAVLAVSLSYMLFVSITPESHRPFVDGSSTGSIFHMVFSYNGLHHSGGSPDQLLDRTLGTSIFSGSQAAGLDRLLTSGYGRTVGWLLPLALFAAIAIVSERRSRPRTDMRRAGALMLGAWLVLYWLLFSVSATMHSYDAAALTPAIAGLLGIGGALAWQRRREPTVLFWCAGAIAVTVVYALWLLPKSGTGLPSWLFGMVLLLGLLGAGGMAWAGWVTRRIEERGADRYRPEWGLPTSLALRAGLVASVAAIVGAVAALLAPTVASASLVRQRLGPYDTPFQPAYTAELVREVYSPAVIPTSLFFGLAYVRAGATDLLAVQSSAAAAPFIYNFGLEVVPLGGYTGTIAWPNLPNLQGMIANGEFHLALISDPGASSPTTYISSACKRSTHPLSPPVVTAPNMKAFYCVS